METGTELRVLIEYSISMAPNSTREGILAAAGEVLADEGFGGFTTAAVADEAGVSQGLVHHYFETKQALLRRVFEWGWERARRDVRSEAEDPRDRLVNLAGYLIAPEDERRERLSVARMDLELRARAIHDERLREVFDGSRAEVLDIVRDIVQDGIERGRFRPVDVDRFAAVFASVVVNAEQLFAIYGHTESSREIVDGLGRLVDEYLVVGAGDSEPDASG